MSSEREPWVMPEWMESYRELIGNTGGNTVEDLMNDRETDARNDLIRWTLIVSVGSQVAVLYQLYEGGYLAQS